MTVHALSDLDTLLSEIPDAPKRIYLQGTLPPQSEYRYLAVVGSRTYSPYGRAACEALIKGLRGYKVCIVSGLALGIDGFAHRAALAAGLPTLAVPGSGLDPRVLYPAAHRALARDILDAGGALLSEFEPLWKPRPESFPQRNRIMAGLSHAVLVVEATERSGTLITSRLATEYNRDVLAVPGPIHSDTSKGPHMLIQKGAAVITKSADILEALGIGEDQQKAHALSNSSPAEERVLMLVAQNQLTHDELIRTLDMPVSDANILLASMELKGLIREELGRVQSCLAI